VVAKKIQYIHTYKYKEIQQTRKKQEKNKKKCNVCHVNVNIIQEEDEKGKLT